MSQTDNYRLQVCRVFPNAKLERRGKGRRINGEPNIQVRVVRELFTGNHLGMSGWCFSELAAWRSAWNRVKSREGKA